MPKTIPLPKLLLTLTLIWTFSLMCHPIFSNDIWWHLKTGQWIFQNLQIPQTDLYTFTYPNKTWINLHWLYQVTQYPLYLLGNLPLLVLTKSFLITTSLLLAVSPALKKQNHLTATLLLFLGTFLLHQRSLVRPETYSYLYFTLTLLLLENHKTHPSKLLYTLPIIQLLWTNTQGIFILGLGIQLIYTLENQTLRHNPYLPTLTLSTLTTLLNPYGLQGTLFPFQLWTRISGNNQIFQQMITEFQPLPTYLTTHPQLTIPLVLLITTLALTYYQNRPHFPLRHQLLILTFLTLATLAIRNISLLTLTLLFTLSHHPLKLPKIKPLPHLYLITILTLLALLYTQNYYPLTQDARQLGLTTAPNRYPTQAVNYIKEHNLTGKIYNHLDDGGYLIWHLYPQCTIFTDTRLEIAGAPFLTLYHQTTQNPHLFDHVAQKHQIHYALIRNQETYQALFKNNPNWQILHYSPQESSLLLKNHTIPTPEKK